MTTLADEFMTTDEVAELCRTNAATVRRWRFERTGPPGARIGKRVLYRRADVRRWLEERFAAEADRDTA